MFYFTFSDPQNLRVTVNHSLSEKPCNQQCIGGCNGTSHLNCFACRRVMDQLSDGRKNCIEQCPDGLLLVRKFCFVKYFLFTRGPRLMWISLLRFFKLFKHLSKGPRFSEKDWCYLQAQTDMPFHYLKLVAWIFSRFLLHRTKY